MTPATLPTERASRQIIWVPKHELSIHEAVLQTPEDPNLINIFETLFNGGDDIADACEITPDNQLLDGRHRWKGAVRVHRIKLIPCVITEEDPETVVCRKLTQRRHYSKSAKAYALRHMAAKAAREGRVNSATQARDARNSESRLNRLSEKKGLTLSDLASNSGLSVDVLQQAMKLERDYMTRADKLVADWLELNPEEAKSWQDWQDMHPTQEMPWTCWRATRLAEMKIPNDPQAVNVIRPNYRELEEDKIFNGVVDKDDAEDRKSYSLGASLKALGSIFATAGKPRTDLDPQTADIVTALQNKVINFTKTMWAQWGTMPPDQRQAVCKKLAEDVRTAWPTDARMILLNNLKEAAK